MTADLAVDLLIVLALPVAAFFGGAAVMTALSGRKHVRKRLCEVAAAQDRKPLNQRWGYDVGAVDRHWRAFDSAAFRAERRFLQLDLVFPLLYGLAMAASLLMAWTLLGYPIWGWLVTPVVVAMMADWVENSLLLGQLQGYEGHGKKALQASQIRVASAATILKLIAFLGALVMLVGLVGAIIVCGPRT